MQYVMTRLHLLMESFDVSDPFTRERSQSLCRLVFTSQTKSGEWKLGKSCGGMSEIAWYDFLSLLFSDRGDVLNNAKSTAILNFINLRGFAPHLFRELPYESDALPTKPPRLESPTVGPSLKQSDEPDSGDEFLMRS